jgi:hypothetical protein
MTDDRHVRIREDGTEEYLPSIPTFRETSEDPDEDKRLENQYQEDVRQIDAMLRAKGFGIDGEEPSSVQVNRLLRLGGTE